MKKLVVLFVLMMVSLSALADVRVVATVPNMGMLVRTIGGDAVQVTVLAPPDRDVHYLEARPSMMAALRRADLLVAVGAELEVGWLPAALAGAHNPSVRVGRTGYFEGAAQIDLIDVGGPADRALGDVHPAGNPHFYFDPLRLAAVGHALAERLAEFDAGNADRFRANAEAFEARAREEVERWQALVEGAPGVVFYHKDADYLAHLMNVPILGYLESLPGIPPTARHLSELVGNLRGREGVILYADFQPSQGAQFLSRELGWPQRQQPMQVGMNATADDYFAMIGRWAEGMRP